MRTKQKPRAAVKPKFTLVVGRIYEVQKYYTGNFRAKCCDSLPRSARLKVTDPMRTELQVNDEIEIPFVHADFIPALITEMQKPIGERFADTYTREEFERDRHGEAGGSRS